MSSQFIDQSNPQNPGGFRQPGNNTKPGVQPQGEPPKVAPTNQPKPMPNPI